MQSFDDVVRAKIEESTVDDLRRAIEGPGPVQPPPVRAGRVLHVNELHARGGPCWWEDTEVLERRRRERWAARFEF